MADGVERLTVALPEGDAERVRVRAARARRSVSAELALLVQAGLGKYAPEPVEPENGSGAVSRVLSRRGS